MFAYLKTLGRFQQWCLMILNMPFMIAGVKILIGQSTTQMLKRHFEDKTKLQGKAEMCSYVVDADHVRCQVTRRSQRNKNDYEKSDNTMILKETNYN